MPTRPSANMFGVLEKHPEMARDGIRLRQFGQQIIESLGGKRIHPAWVVPGGVSEPLTEENRDIILADFPEALQIAERTLDWYKSAPKACGRRSLLSATSPRCSWAWSKDNDGLDLL